MLDFVLVVALILAGCRPFVPVGLGIGEGGFGVDWVRQGFV